MKVSGAQILAYGLAALLGAVVGTVGTLVAALVLAEAKISTRGYAHEDAWTRSTEHEAGAAWDEWQDAMHGLVNKTEEPKGYVRRRSLEFDPWDKPSYRPGGTS